MKKYIYKSGILALFASVLFSGCDPEIDQEAVPSSGEADFSTYVALGNSLTAGFQDGALYREGQTFSYPAILADQFEEVGGSDLFRQPLLPENVSAGSPRINAEGNMEVPQRLILALKQDCQGTSLAPVEAGAPGNFSAFAAPTEQGPYNNLGVPGAKAVHLLAPGYGNQAGIATGTANPFFARFASSPGTSVIADAMALDPTFFTLWIGNNDALGYALAGGVDDNLLTSPADFNNYIGAIVTALTAKGAKGAVANIPDVEKIPYFTTIPYNGLVLNAQQAEALKAAYAGRGIFLDFKAGANPFVVAEDGQVRFAKQGELILLPTSGKLKCEGLGSITPLADKDVLSETELVKIREAVEAYNNTLKAVADAKDLAFVDINSYLDRLANGFKIDEVSYNAALVTGNAFSLDGIHFTPRAAALVANEFIRAINAEYNANVPTVDVTKYRTVVFP